MFIFPSGSSALLGRPCCDLFIWLSLLAIFNTLFWVLMPLFFMRKWTKYKNTHGLPYFSYMIWKWPSTVTRHQGLNILTLILPNCLKKVYVLYDVERISSLMNFSSDRRSPINYFSILLYQCITTQNRTTCLWSLKWLLYNTSFNVFDFLVIISLQSL